MPPIPIEAKDIMRRFFRGRILQSKAQAGIAAMGAIIVKEHEMEDFLDEMWFYVNKELLAAKQDGSDSK